MIPRRPASRILLFIAALTLLKAVAAGRLELTSVEAYHWMYAQHPAPGYYDHPAMIGWLVWLSTAVFGDGSLGARWLTLLGGSLAVWLAFLAGRRMYDERAGLWAALLTGTVPLFFAYGAQATPDAPLLLFWTGAVWALAHVLSGGRPAWWYAAGAFLGLAMLSKYQAVFLAAGVLVFLACERREWLRRPQPYVAAAIALAIFSPTIVWNAMNGWASLSYQGVGRFQESPGFTWRHVVDFPVEQLKIVTPFVCLWAWFVALRALARWRSAAWQDRLCVCLGMPVLLFFAATAFARSTRGHWTAPGYVSLMILAGAALLRGGRLGRLLNGGTVALLGLAYLAIPVFVAAVPRDQVSGWAQLAAEVRRRTPDFVIGRDYHDASQLGYHLRPTAACDFTAVGRPAKAFATWWHGAAFAGKDAVVVWAARAFPEGLDLVRARFAQVGEPVEVSVTRWGGRREKYVLVEARGYRR